MEHMSYTLNNTLSIPKDNFFFKYYCVSERCMLYISYQIFVVNNCRFYYKKLIVLFQTLF